MSESSDLQRAVERLTTSIEQLRVELVRKDVYESNERGRDRELSDLRDDLREVKDKAAEEARERRADRRIMYGAIASSVATMLISLYGRVQGVN